MQNLKHEKEMITYLSSNASWGTKCTGGLDLSWREHRYVAAEDILYSDLILNLSSEMDKYISR